MKVKKSEWREPFIIFHVFMAVSAQAVYMCCGDVKNIVIKVAMNLHYSFVIIKCKRYCKIKA